MNSNWLAGAAIVLVVLVGGYTLTHGSANGSKGDTGAQGPQGEQGIAGSNGVNGQSFGSVTGPDVDSFCTTQNGVTRCTSKTKLKTATTTPAALRAPTAASSTLVFAACQINTASATAITWTQGKATNAFATTTNLNGADYVTAASKQDFIQASTSPTSTKSNIFAPGSYFVLSETGGITAGDAAGTGFVPAGTCAATWQY